MPTAELEKPPVDQTPDAGPLVDRAPEATEGFEAEVREYIQPAQPPVPQQVTDDAGQTVLAAPQAFPQLTDQQLEEGRRHPIIDAIRWIVVGIKRAKDMLTRKR